MTKDQFQIWTYHFADRGGDHPCVLVSHPDLCAGASRINILYCTSQRQSRGPKPHEIALDESDGLDWQTFVDCSILFVADSSKLFNHRGEVGWNRRNAIRDKIRDMFLLAARD
jgi:hypothetical protein